MNIREAVIEAINRDGWIVKRDRDPSWMLYVAVGGVFRDRSGNAVSLDARDCKGDDWCVVPDENHKPNVRQLPS